MSVKWNIFTSYNKKRKEERSKWSLIDLIKNYVHGFKHISYGADCTFDSHRNKPDKNKYD